MTRTHRPPRRGISTLWLLLTLPIFLILLVFTVDIANLWLARVELENGLEAAALAAVREWGEAGGGSTEAPRDVGVAYAAANQIRGLPITIATNLGAESTGNPNANLSCCPTAGSPPEGNLVLGTITSDDPLTFDARIAPSCGVGSVLLDATGQGNLDADNAWGVAFLNVPDTPAGLRIKSITIDLRGSGGAGSFVFDANSPRLSDNVAPHAIPGQEDIAGFSDPNAQIQFSYNPAQPQLLTINFAADGSTDDGFAPGDRFRFGARVINVGQGLTGNDGDGIGDDRVRVRVDFELNGQALQPVYRTFVDTMGLCPWTGSEPWFPYLPCPPSSAANNNGQSYVVMNGAGNNDFAVRAQATVSVNSLARKLLGDSIGPYSVTSKVTARYNCSEDRAWLIRVERFICP